ncbi:hypothetical protein M2901_10065 (plasmid) [Vagococcus lutrae]|uniref:hypothetical protein n=1 Tax=Vagococcus lutrae TaxID=81947 RepID=UPI00200F0BAD|nr:hypothetical protein [Vagococcus lutrae]UQF72094.1 hypothetical protein M2901_10065 [Vagococcus lutrae]
MKIKLNVNESFILGAIQNRTVDRPISSTEIKGTWNYTDVDVRRFIHTLRKKGVPIASNHKGYYMPADKDEWVAYLHSFNERINEMLNVHKEMQKVDDVMEWKNQIEHESYYLKNKDNEQIELFFDDIA